jgi:hypothetical protein
MRTSSQILNQFLMAESEFQVGGKVRDQILIPVWRQVWNQALVLVAISRQLREMKNENK